MEFKISLDWGKKKSITPNVIPEIWDNSTFYTINATSQNSTALISMYNDLPEIQIPVNYLLDSMSVIPYYHYRNGEKVENSPYIETLDNPNQYQTRTDYIKMFELNRIVLGAGYTNKVKAIGMPKTQLYVLPTQKTEAVLSETNLSDIRTNSITGFITDFGQGQIKLTKEEVFYQLEIGLIPDNYFVGRSRLMSAILTSDTLRFNYEARLKSLKDRGASYIISPSGQEDTLTPEQAQQMREKYHSENGITGNKFPGLISPRSLSVANTSLNIGELELLGNKETDLSTVCNVLQVSPILFNVGKPSFNNLKVANTSFWEDTVPSYFNAYLELHERVFDLPANEEFRADYSDIPSLQSDLEKLTNSSSKAWNDNVLYESEYRQAIGKEGGEEKTKSQLEGNTEGNQE
jgi:HK97 family phage portal protein